MPHRCSIVDTLPKALSFSFSASTAGPIFFISCFYVYTPIDEARALFFPMAATLRFDGRSVFPLRFTVVLRRTLESSPFTIQQKAEKETLPGSRMTLP